MPERPTKKIAIVGTARTTLHDAPYNDPTWEVWGLNALWTFEGVRWDRWFELHDRAGLQTWMDGRHWAWLKKQQPGKPLYMQEAYDDVPAAIKFPADKVLAEFPPYFTNSVAWMTALAVVEGATDIGLWGVDMANQTEYAHQRQNCEFVLGIAAGRGVNIVLPAASDLLKSDHLYAIEKPSPLMAKLLALKKAHAAHIESAEQKLAQLREQEKQAEAELNQFMGALQACALITDRR